MFPKMRTGPHTGCGIFLKSPRLTCDLPAVVEVHVHQFRAALESLDVACSSCSLFKGFNAPSERSREKIPTKGADWCAKEISRKSPQRLTFEAVDVAQVDARHVRDVRQVLRQSELAAAAQVDGASVGADVADHANDSAGEDTWNTKKGTFREMRTGAQRRAQEISFDVCSPSIFVQRLKFTLVTFGQFSST